MRYRYHHKSLFTIAGILLVCLILLPVATAGELTKDVQAEHVETYQDDPFAVDPVLSEQHLRNTRGGFIVGGFDIEFAVIVTQHDGTLATVASDPLAFIDGLEAQGFSHQFPITREMFLAMDQGIATTVLENTLDNVTIAKDISLNLLISNYAQQVSLGSTMTMDMHLLPQSLMTGF